MDHNVTFVCPLVRITPSHLYVPLYRSHLHICMFTCMDHTVTFVCPLVRITTLHSYVSIYGSQRHICMSPCMDQTVTSHLYVPSMDHDGSHRYICMSPCLCITPSHLYVPLYRLRFHICIFSFMDYDVTFACSL